MARRLVIALLVVVLIGAAAAVGIGGVSLDAGEPTYAPDQIQGHEQTRNITGAEAKAHISELHKRSGAVAGYQKAVVADYGPETDVGPLIRVYASVYNRSEMAGDNITRMVDTMDRSPMFDIENTTVESRTVYLVKREEVVFAFFSYRDTAYWVTHAPSDTVSTEELVSEIIRKNRESRQVLPW